MPYKPARPCAHSGCPLLTTNKERYCDQHLKERNQQIDQRRGTSTERGYDGTWSKLRLMVLRNEPLCRECKKNGLIVAATDVDHIDGKVEHVSFGNLQPLCHNCHSRKTAIENHAFGNR